MNNIELAQVLYDKQIEQGKKDIIKLFIFIIVMEALIPYLVLYATGFKHTSIKEYALSTAFRISLYGVFFYYIWNGHRWARILVGSFLVLGSLIFGAGLMASDKFPSSGLPLLYAITYIVFGVFAGMALLTAKNMRLFFDYRRDYLKRRKLKKMKIDSNYPYDIAISFAGENRELAEKLADLLIDKGLSVFYDKIEEHKLLGKNLYTYLQTIYKDSSQFCIILISEHYVKKPWTLHELEQIQTRIFEDRTKNLEYLLPIRIDDTEIPGLNSITGYIDLRNRNIKDVANIIYKKFLEFENNINKSLERNI